MPSNTQLVPELGTLTNPNKKKKMIGDILNITKEELRYLEADS